MQSEPDVKRRVKRQLGRALLVLGAILLLGSIGMFVAFMSQFGYYAEDNTDLKEISSATHLRFPPGAKMQHGQNESFEDDFYYAMISFDRRYVDSFVRAVAATQHSKAGYVARVSTTDRFGINDHLHESRSWWRPDAVRAFKAVKMQGSERMEDLSMLIGLDDPHRAVVYIDYSSD